MTQQRCLRCGRFPRWDAVREWWCDYCERRVIPGQLRVVLDGSGTHLPPFSDEEREAPGLPADADSSRNEAGS